MQIVVMKQTNYNIYGAGYIEIECAPCTMMCITDTYQNDKTTLWVDPTMLN